MATIIRFEDIEAWKKAREVTKQVYNWTNTGQFARDFGLRDQLRRCSVSVMSNIAEGFEREGNKEFINFLSIAKGSCGEARSQLYVALDQDYITSDDFEFGNSGFDQVAKMIGGLMNYLKESEFKGRKFK